LYRNLSKVFVFIIYYAKYEPDMLIASLCIVQVMHAWYRIRKSLSNICVKSFKICLEVKYQIPQTLIVVFVNMRCKELSLHSIDLRLLLVVELLLIVNSYKPWHYHAVSYFEVLKAQFIFIIMYNTFMKCTGFIVLWVDVTSIAIG